VDDWAATAVGFKSIREAEEEGKKIGLELFSSWNGGEGSFCPRNADAPDGLMRQEYARISNIPTVTNSKGIRTLRDSQEI
jgi:hypothetical protein